MNDNPLFSSFMMLSEHLYKVFVQYIVHGRSRAPPETALIEMLPTFQFGAKTDRRALQSKFKSWAKRMIYENGHLKLVNSGKIIIPKEKCDDLVMYLHSEEHLDIEKLIAKIRMKYSWTRKNFGMDRDVIVEIVMRNCQKEDCLKSMRMEMARLSTSLCSSTLNSQGPQPFPEMSFGLAAPLPCLPPYTYRWPLAFPVPHVFHPGDFPIQIPFFNNMYSIGDPRVACNQTASGSPIPIPDRKVAVSHPGGDRSETKVEANTGTISSTSSAKAGEAFPSTVKFKKPKNVHEYKTLMEAVRCNPADFPKILGKEKTQFLSILGIAPKNVCSTRTLRKFRKELRHKRLMNSECMVYRERKALRDRNKLKKHSHEKARHLFLGVVARKDLNSTSSEKSRSDTLASKQSRLLKVPKKLHCEQNDGGSNTKRMKVSDTERIEVIDIFSSDDESQQKSVSMFSNKDESNASQNQSNVLSNNLTPEIIEEKNHVTDIKITEDNHEKDKREDFDGRNENLKVENNRSANFKDENLSKLSSLIKCQANKTNNNVFNVRPILLPKVVKNVPIVNRLTNPSNISLEAKRAQTPKIIVSSIASRPSAVPKYSTNYVFPPTNAGPIVIRPLAPPNLQQNIVVSDQNVPRYVYPLPVSKSPMNNIRLLLADKNQKEAFYILPQYNRPILPQTFARNESQGTFEPETQKKAEPMPTITSQLQQLRQINAEKERILLDKMYNKDKTKIDINEEMTRISKWIYRMKANLNPNMFQHGIEKSVHKLLSQLEIGICLVREAKKSLTEIENSMGSEMPSEEVNIAE